MQKKQPRLARLGLLLLLCIGCFACSEKDNKKQGKAQLAHKSPYPDIDSISLLILEDSTQAELYAARARLFYKRYGYDEAIRDLASAMKIDSANAEYHALLSDIYLDYSKSRMALRTMERAAKLHPKDPATLLKLAKVQVILRQYPQALESIHNAIQVDPDNSSAFLLMGTTLEEMGETERARKAYEKSTSLDSRQTDAWISLAQMMIDKKDPRARTYLETAMRLDSSSPIVLHAQAHYLATFDQVPEALALYKRIRAEHPEYINAYYNAGILYLQLDSLDQAKVLFDMTIEKKPLYVQAYYYRGLVEENRHNLKLARLDYRKALEMAPEYEKAREAMKRIGEGGK